jgi:hypothetical protein
MNICRNCGEHLRGTICHRCGQPRMEGRWQTTVLIEQFIHHVTNIEKGFTYTIIKLLTAPGELIREYWKGKTIRAYNPFRFVLICVAASVLLNFLLGIDDLLQETLQPQMIQDEFGPDRVAAADQSFDSWLNVLVLLLIPFNSIVTYYLFNQHKHNYAEHLIMNSYSLGIQGALGIIVMLVFMLMPDWILAYLGINLLVGIGYNTYLFRHVFSVSWTSGLAKAVVVSLASLIVYFLLVVLFSAIALAFS